MPTKPLLIIGGPTASGKTDLAIRIALKFNGELVNADSRQIYKYFNIGTNKGSLESFNTIQPHKGVNPLALGSKIVEDKVVGWLFDFLEPEEDFTVSDYQELAQRAIADIQSRKKLPIVVGGTGLYIDSLIKPYRFSISPNLKLREKLKGKSVVELLKIYTSKGGKDLNESDRKNPARLIRLIEKLTSVEKNYNNKKYRAIFGEYIFLYPEFTRKDLYAKINMRVLQMFEEGFIEEVKSLVEKGYENTKPMQGIGYREVLKYLKNTCTLEETKKLIQTAHRQYAKRQITWFEGAGRNYTLVRINNANFETIIKNYLAKKK